MILGGSDGANMVEAFAHCGEWQTPRGALGAVDHGAWLRGAPNPAGQGRIPPVSPDELTWSKDQIAAYLMMASPQALTARAVI